MLEAHPVLTFDNDVSLPLLTPFHSTDHSDIPGEVEARVAEGFRTLKVKVGKNWEEDVAKVRIVQQAAKGRAVIRLDANRGFNREDGNDYHMPHQFDRNCVVYTGTHDNDTSSGWFRSLSRGGQRKRREVAKRFLATNGKEIHWDLIRCAMTSVANVAIVPAQDLLGLGSSARMNTPGVAEGNWRWRLKDGDLDAAITRRLGEIVRVTGRSV